MGVEYRHLALPTPRTFRPSPEQLASLIARLRADRWLPVTAPRVCPEGTWPPAPGPDLLDVAWTRTVRDARVSWSVDPYDPAELRYPLDALPDDEEPYYDIGFDLSEDFTVHGSACLDEIGDRCACGHPLREIRGQRPHIWFRIPVVCPRCRLPFDPLTRTVQAADPWTGRGRPLPGGATYRFLWFVDCGKCWPACSETPALHEDLASAIEDVLGVDLLEVGDAD